MTMASIKEILALDFSEDIKKVIDLEDLKDQEIKDEIDNYIVTPKIAEYFSYFVKQYKSNIKETGVWISGFYGSGKSYFGKNLGHILSNRTIMGTTARERFVKRLSGLKNANLLENDILGLDAYNSKVIFLDAAKQHTGDGGFSWTLFKNFLKSFGFLDNYMGYIEYSLYLRDEYDEFLELVKKVEGREWTEVKKDPIASIIFRRIMTSEKYSEAEYNEFKSTVDYTIKNFDAAKLRDQLQLYLEKFTNERIVFILDEASAAIAQRKFTLLDLEGISEALTSLNKKVWTIAIAQQKLDDVINNANVSRSNLVKVTDRFKTQIHLESTDVELIVRERLLKKKEQFEQKLKEFFNNNIGKISDYTKLQATFLTTVDNDEEFSTYYPFHKYQFRLLQNFLFKSNVLAKTQIAERGMIITTFDVIRNRLLKKELFDVATAYDIASEGQLKPPIEISRSYSKAEIRLKEISSPISGDYLLKVIHFLSESENEATATSENITKCYIDNIEEDYYKSKGEIEKALKDLVSINVLIEDNNIYKIASDQEQKIITEMNSFQVGDFNRKSYITKQLKGLSQIKNLANVTYDSVNFPFSVQSDLDDDLVSATNKYLKVRVYNIKNVEKDWSESVENIKNESYSVKNQIYIVPKASDSDEINKLIEQVLRFEQIEDRYSGDSDPDVRKIIKQFSSIKEAKRNRLDQLIRDSYLNGIAIYNSDERNLGESEFKNRLTEIQKRLIDNTYPKRLSSNVSEDIAKHILKEKHPGNLHVPFDHLGNDFQFFDNNGNFVGDHLKVVEEITTRIQSSFVDGKSLEVTLGEPPCGYTYGIVCTTLAALFRSGKLIVKYNGDERFDYSDPETQKVFISSREFQKASFKAITKTLSASKKNDIIQSLQQINVRQIIDKEIDYSTNDFEIVDAVTLVSKNMVEILTGLHRSISEFDTFFKDYNELLTFFKEYTDKTTESNYIFKADAFVTQKTDFIQKVKRVNSIESFVQKKLPTVKKFNEFVEGVSLQLSKLGSSLKDHPIHNFITDFNSKFSNNLAEHYGELQNLAQSIKDEYYRIFETEHQKMFDEHTKLKAKAESLKEKIKSISEDLNKDLLTEVEDIITYAQKRSCKNYLLGYDTKCETCAFTLFESSTATEAISIKGNQLFDIESRIISKKDSGKSKEGSKQKVKVKLKKGVIPVSVYKKHLLEQLNIIEKLDSNDSIDLDIEVE